MNNEKTEIKDKLLRYLCENENKSTQVSDIAAEINISHDLVFTLTAEFEERGFVRSIETSSKSAFHRDKMVILESKGRVFFNDGGYTQEEKEKKRSVRKEFINTSLDNASKIFAILGVIGTIGFGSYSYTLSKKVNSLQKEIKGLKINHIDTLNDVKNNPPGTPKDSTLVKK